jgi:ribonuclease P protein component
MSPGDSSPQIKRFTLPRSRIVRQAADFQRVYNLRASVADAALVVYAAPNGRRVSRVGLSVGRKHGGSVRRNRIKRLLRETFRLLPAAVPPGYDFILVPRAFGETTLADLLAAWPGLVAEAVRRADRKSPAAPPQDRG